jgi:hypothetical protein
MDIRNDQEEEVEVEIHGRVTLLSLTKMPMHIG